MRRAVGLTGVLGFAVGVGVRMRGTAVALLLPGRRFTGGRCRLRTRLADAKPAQVAFQEFLAHGQGQALGCPGSAVAIVRPTARSRSIHDEDRPARLMEMMSVDAEMLVQDDLTSSGGLAQGLAFSRSV
jgi:hypothetical protein